MDLAPATIPLTKIHDALTAASKQYNVRILLATEEGSRAWGLANPDSDFDVKFVYMHEPGWYTRLDEAQRDVIDFPVEGGFLDLNGWDIRKAVKMLRESNCSILSWLQADIYYAKNEPFVAEARELGHKYISWKSVAFHFVNKAKKHMREYFDGPRWKEEVIHKKYFFVIHPLLSVLWVMANANKIPPNLISELLSVQLCDTVRKEINNLIERKRNGDVGNGPRISVLDEWIAATLVAVENYAKNLPVLKHPSSDEFNALIAKYVLSPDCPTVPRVQDQIKETL